MLFLLFCVVVVIVFFFFFLLMPLMALLLVCTAFCWVCVSVAGTVGRHTYTHIHLLMVRAAEAGKYTHVGIPYWNEWTKERKREKKHTHHTNDPTLFATISTFSATVAAAATFACRATTTTITSKINFGSWTLECRLAAHLQERWKWSNWMDGWMGCGGVCCHFDFGETKYHYKLPHNT